MGVVLTLFIYAVLMLLAGFLLYAFMLNLHLDGRMLDRPHLVQAEALLARAGSANQKSGD